VEAAPTRQAEELLLSASLDPLHALSRQLRCDVGRQLPPVRGVQGLDTRYDASDRGPTGDTGGALDFRQFGHGVNSTRQAGRDESHGHATIMRLQWSPRLARLTRASTLDQHDWPAVELMAHHLQRSLRHEYDIYVEQEIESYKDSIPRSALLRLGDEAVGQLRQRNQLEFSELLIWAEVDTLIRRRCRIPTFATWSRRRLKLLAEYRRPERWGLAADAPLVREVGGEASERHVLIAGIREEGMMLYLAANGCQVTAVEDDPDVVERVMNAAGVVGLTSRVNGCSEGLDHWLPDEPLHAVVCAPAAFERLSLAERTRVIDILKSATLDGGVHLVETLVAGHVVISDDELRDRYRGWDISIVRDQRANRTFMARKNVA
jgi:hypothetical protein